MSKRFYVCTLMLFLLYPALLCAELLDLKIESAIRDKVDELKIGDAVIDLNVRISIPENVEAGLEATELFATVVRPASQADPAYDANRPNGRPTILIATCYRREMMLMMYLTLLSHDYNVMALDVRGTGSAAGQA